MKDCISQGQVQLLYWQTHTWRLEGLYDVSDITDKQSWKYFTKKLPSDKTKDFIQLQFKIKLAVSNFWCNYIKASYF